MVLFEKTPKAFATFSPGFKIEIVLNPERLANRQTLSGFLRRYSLCSQGCRWRSNPGLKLANAFGVLAN